MATYTEIERAQEQVAHAKKHMDRLRYEGAAGPEQIEQARQAWVDAWNRIEALQSGGSVEDLDDPSTETLRTSKGDVVVTHLSDQEAVDVLVKTETVTWNQFASDLVGQFNLAVAGRKRPLSDRQRPWLHKLALEALERQEKRAEQAAQEPVEGGFQSIVDMLHRAGESLKHPRVLFGGLRMSVAGPNSRQPGSISVTSDERSFDDRTWYGRITTGGAFQPGRDCPSEVTEILERFAADPAGQAKTHGQKYGNCCFCQRELVTTESLAAGYGPVCAERYGLPWG